ncbi:inositol-trisphosphate 3-kinase-like protein isoform 1-T1 [Glossina fuscipes fuscipes]
MTSTILQPTTANGETSNICWETQEKLRFSCIDNIKWKQLWKIIALDTYTNNEATAKRRNHNLRNKSKESLRRSINSNEEHKGRGTSEDFAYYPNQSESEIPNRMSLLKFLAINALELSAPATPILLQQQQGQQTQKQPQDKQNHPNGWLQLSGHPESIVPTCSGVVRKRVNTFNDYEVLAYRHISLEPETATIVPRFFGSVQLDTGDRFIELQDLLNGFKDPCVIDIKMGCRTFLESEVSNKTLRPDLYQKMLSVDRNAPTAEEHEAQAITKLRYMLFREAMSSSQTKGFRIEALRLRGKKPINDLKTVRSSEQIFQTIEQFIGSQKGVQKEIIKRLKHMRSVIERSSFFQMHEIIGSSIFIVYDHSRVGCWLIDFVKSRPLPMNVKVNHRSEWLPGNHEEGLLRGLDNLITAFEEVYNRSKDFTRKCLQI